MRGGCALGVRVEAGRDDPPCQSDDEDVFEVAPPDWRVVGASNLGEAAAPRLRLALVDPKEAEGALGHPPPFPAVGTAPPQCIVFRSRTLSGGEWSRASLAVALLGKPELLLLDEPTVDVDPILRRELWQTFYELADAGASLLVSSHVMDEAARCHELVLMRSGRIIATGSPADLLERTHTDELEDAFVALAEAA